MGYRDRVADYSRDDDRVAAAAVRLLRMGFPSVSGFAGALAFELGWGRLSRQAVYDWESGRSRVPASVLLAACRVSSRSVDDVLAAAAKFIEPARVTNIVDEAIEVAV